MRLIKSSFEILEQETGLDGIYKAIERAGRTCYKSEDRITEDSAKKFVDMLIDKGHTACLEQGTVYLYSLSCEHNLKHYRYNQYSRYRGRCGYKEENQGVTKYYNHEYVTTNYRVLYENGWLDDLKYVCEPTEYHSKRHTVRFICDRGVSHELVRHRVFSFAQESTRYCNYSKDKFGNELTFIIPSWINDIEDGTVIGDNYFYTNREFPEEISNKPKDIPVFSFYPYTAVFVNNLKQLERAYLGLIRIEGKTPQEARQVLPNALKTEVVMTGFAKDWNHFFDLRCALPAHPDMRALAVPLKGEFINRNYI